MAENQKPADDETEEGQAPKKGVLPFILVGVLASVIGAVVPVGMQMMMAAPEKDVKPPPYDVTPSLDDMVFIPYGEVTVNLDEGRMNRYLRLSVVLHVRKSDEELVKKAVAEKELLLRNWLLSHLSDKHLDEIRGKAGQNMLRREIRDYFNGAMFTDNYERIYDVLFQEFNVQ